MKLELIQNKIIKEIGRETIDRFVEENGELVRIETLSVEEIVKHIYNMCIVSNKQLIEKVLDALHVTGYLNVIDCVYEEFKKDFVNDFMED